MFLEASVVGHDWTHALQQTSLEAVDYLCSAFARMSRRRSKLSAGQTAFAEFGRNRSAVM